MSDVDWKAFVARIRAYPAKVHKILPPCSADRLDELERQLGAFPNVLLAMLKEFNGLKLFISGGPWMTIFGVSTVPLLPPLICGPEWYIDKFVPRWRSTP
jgi:hypothetical protein